MAIQRDQGDAADFSTAQARGVPEAELYQVFIMGVGMTVIAARERVEEVCGSSARKGSGRG
jgi:phosphoribosylaminoimidazole (AIR) synthetase